MTLQNARRKPEEVAHLLTAGFWQALKKEVRSLQFVAEERGGTEEFAVGLLICLYII